MMPNDVGAMFEAVKAWGRWGPHDERGALNLLTPQRVAAAARLVDDGLVVACGRALGTAPAIDDPTPALHAMLIAGDAPLASGVPGFEESVDYLGIACHGMSVSHIDALCHVFVDGRMYNGYPASDVKSVGAMRNSIAAAADGIVGRAVLLDLTQTAPSGWLEPGEVVGPEMLQACCERQGSQLVAGDILLVHTGRDARRNELGAWSPFNPGLPGLGPDCVPWLAQKDLSVLGTDVIADPLPPTTATWPFPIHQCCIAGMGVHLIDNLNLLAVAQACAQRERWEFFFSVHPLRAMHATGSPVNPVAVF